MKILTKLGLFSLILSIILGFSVMPAKAYYGSTPYLIATNQGGFTQISVSNSNPYSQVSLYEQQQNSSLWTVINNFGTTDGNGYFTQQISLGAMTAYVVVGGMQSNTVTINSYNNCSNYYNVYGCNNCTYNCGTGISLSPNTVSLVAGQNSTVSILNNYSGTAYISNNSNQGVVSATVSGNTITLYGLSAGSATLNICTNSYSQCANLFVTVTGNSNYGNITFSQSNISLSQNQSMTVYVYGNGGNNFYVSGNTNNNAVIANLAGNALNLTGYNAGSSSVTVCQSNGGCGVLSVTVNNNGYGNGSITFSQTNPVLNAGQSTSVLIYGNAPFYISANPNSNIVSASISGSTLYLWGNSAGSSAISVCSSGYNNGCGSIYVTVNGSNYSYNNGGSVLGASVYANGQLISVNGTVYMVYKNTLTAFANASAFTGLGYSFGSVYSVNYPSGMTISGYVISSPFAAHPWGSWIKSGSTVYFVSQYGLIPVPDWSTFLNNGGQANVVVNANSWDFQQPMLSPMIYSDSRLR